MKSTNSKKQSSKEKESKEKDKESNNSKQKSKGNEKEATLNNVSKIETEKNDSTLIKDRSKIDNTNDRISEKSEEKAATELIQKNGSKPKSEATLLEESKQVLNTQEQEKGPKLSSNAQKLKDLEDQMLNLEKILESMESKLFSSGKEKERMKDEIEKLNKNNETLRVELDAKLSTKVKVAFTKEFDVATKKIVDLEEENEKLRKQIAELESTNSNLNVRIKLQDAAINDYKDELIRVNKNCEGYREAYEETIRENDQYKSINEQSNKTINSLKIELDEIKMVIGRLTEVRVILNKYFSSYFENFTPNEKMIINDVKTQLNQSRVEPEETGFILNNNAMKRSSINLQNTSANNQSRELNYDYDNVAINKLANKKLDDTLTKNNNSKIKKNDVADVKTPENNEANGPNLTSTKRGITNNNKNSVSYNPDDDFWYENKRTRK